MATTSSKQARYVLLLNLMKKALLMNNPAARLHIDTRHFEVEKPS
jgi:hypothetical protein